MVKHDSSDLQWWQTWQTGVVIGILMALPYILLRLVTNRTGAELACANGIDVILNIAYVVCLLGMGVVVRYNYVVRPNLTRQERWREIAFLAIGMPLLGILLFGAPSCIAALVGN